jgi:hypothetical protein
MPLEDRALNRLQKKAKRGMRGWPAATIAFYGPDAKRATKVAVGIVMTDEEEPARDARLVYFDRRRAQQRGDRDPDLGFHRKARRSVDHHGTARRFGSTERTMTNGFDVNLTRPAPWAESSSSRSEGQLRFLSRNRG